MQIRTMEEVRKKLKCNKQKWKIGDEKKITTIGENATVDFQDRLLKGYSPGVYQKITTIGEKHILVEVVLKRI